MKARQSLRRLCAVILMVAVVGAPACLLADQPVQETIHFLAPSDAYAAQFDPLIAESALRLAAMELAVRHGMPSRFLPIDQQGHLAGEAYPRLQITCGTLPQMNHLRLVRRGQEFSAFVSAKGQEYIPLWRMSLDMPSRTYVGMLLRNSPTAQETECVLSKFLINGQDAGNLRPTNIGWGGKTGHLSHADGTWRLTTYGYRAVRFDNSMSALVAYAPQAGDFQIDVAVKTHKSDFPWRVAGPVCLAALDFDHPGIALLRAKTKCGLGLARPPLVSMKSYCDDSLHLAAIQWATAPGDSKTLAEVPVSCATWDQLEDSVASLADAIEAGLERELSLGPPSSPDPEPTAKRLAALDEARAKVLEVNSGTILRAAAQVDQALTDLPTCPQAHYTASLAGAVLALQDPYGAFHERGRFLAGPLSHWMLAKRLAPPTRDADRLSGAWLMLACGYPLAATDVTDALPAGSDSPEARALHMFATCDYRPLDPNTVLSASPIEQLAWTEATNDCGLSEPREAVCADLVRRHRSAAFVPRRSDMEVAPGHTAWVLCMATCFARDAFDLLTSPQLPPQTRQRVAAAMIRNMNLPPWEDLLTQARAVAWSIFHEADDRTVIPNVAILMDLYRAAATQPIEFGGPDRLLPPCMPIHDFADVQRGLFLAAVYDRICFVQEDWSVRELAGSLSQEMADATALCPDVSLFFRAASLSSFKKYEDSKATVLQVLGTPLGRQYALTSILTLEWPAKGILLSDMRKLTWPAARGAWDLQNLARLRHSDHAEWVACYNTSFACRRVDPWNVASASYVARSERNLEDLKQMAQRLPYSVRVLRSIRSCAMDWKQWDDAEWALRRQLTLTPQDPMAYRSLAIVVLKRGRRAEAIQVAEEAMRVCPWSVGKSTLMGELAVWLVRESRPEEALMWGEQSRQSGSFVGLRGYAVALAANGRTREALEAYRDLALRFGSAAQDYLDFLIDQGASDTDIMEAITSLARTHADILYLPAEGVAESLQRDGRTSLLAQAYAGPLAAVPPDLQKSQLLLCALSERDFPATLEYAHQLRQLRPLDADELRRAHMAARLLGRQDAKAELEQQLRTVSVQRASNEWYFNNIFGPITAEETIARNPHPPQASLVYWLLGIERECRGDVSGAMYAYQDAAQAFGDDDYADTTAGRWWRRMSRQAASSPASAPSTQQGLTGTQPSQPTTADR